jgi:hypothetical protein
MRHVAFILLVVAILQPFAVHSQVKQSIAHERTTVDLTIYNQNLSLIREERNINLSSGISSVLIPDIPSTIDGTSLHFLSLKEPTGVRVLEQSYQYDLVNQAKLLEKYIGRNVEFIRLNEETKKEYRVEGKLLSSSFSGGLVAEIDGKVEINPSGRLALPSLPEGLILKPQLEWLVETTSPGEHKTEISYLAGSLSWNANYVALLDKSDTKLDMTGWVTLINNSGTTFNDAGLKLVAGDVNVVKKDFDGRQMMMAMAEKAAEPQFKQTELFEYKLYTLQRRTTLRNNATKQIELINGRNVAAKKVFLYDGLSDQWRYWLNDYSYRNQGSFGQQSNQKVGVFVLLKNDSKSGLGIPLPGGKVRVYKRDDDGKEQFIGEDQINHTPKDEEMKLYLGNAFDIVGERAQKDFKSFAGGRVVEETIEIKIRNHKKEAIEVLVYEHPWRWSEWKITKSSMDWEKIDQSTLKFPVKVGKDEESVITYTIRYSW